VTGQDTWTAGELARRTGVTARALHHYDALGLLRPSRDAGGRRRYTAADVRRLHRILALRGFGLRLGEIGQLLDGGRADLGELLRRQLTQTEERIAAARRLRRDLREVLGRLDRDTEPSTEELIGLIEVMVDMNTRLTPEQLAEMTRRREEMMAELTPEQLAELRRRREEATSRMSAEEREEANRRRAALLPD
jgi:DNA-binding transcriptional MerR regulator